MRYLPKELTNEIRQKYNFLQHQEKYSLESQCRKIASRRIAKNAQVHSYEIENPHLSIPFSIPRNNKKKMIKNGIKNMETAFAWGVNNFDPLNFDESFIRELAGKIYPEIHHNIIAQYRSNNVRILGASKLSPDSYKVISREIPWFVDSLRRQLSCGDIVNKVQAAIFSHLHIARIHPFEDGNGRTARTLQNVILTSYKIPSPLISAGERHFYYTCLDEAVKGWSDNETEEITTLSDGERLFYEFIAGKINNSFDIVINNY
jgi:Fic family protein